MPGPPPKKNALRLKDHKAQSGFLKLPAEGRTGRTPKWPLGGRTPAGWVALWKKPQAVMWEQHGTELVVARYLLLRNLVQNPKSVEEINAAAWSELRQLEDRLGLTPMAMLRLRWEIAPDEMEEKRQEKTASTRRRQMLVVAEEMR